MRDDTAVIVMRARARKASALADALTAVGATAADLPTLPDDAWHAAAAAAGVPPPSEATRVLVATIMQERTR